MLAGGAAGRGPLQHGARLLMPLRSCTRPTVSFRLSLSSQPSAPSRGSLLQLWNASQLEMVFYGKMHGFMRSVRWWIVSFSCMNDFPTFDALLVLKNTGISVI